jgi:MoaA/NifB/PqqE/SkfB family radical SAM enzyme
MRVEHPIRSLFDIAVRGAPVEAQLVVTRRCNLSCGYCSEYDHHSPEVPLETLERRIDAIHRLRACNIALLGGEPLLHSRIDDVIRYGARRAQVSMTTNGFLLDDELIARLGDAGLSNLQLSIDALSPDRERYLQKTLRSLRPKLDRLAARARFKVHVTVVLCAETIDVFPELMRELTAYPFRISINPVHDERGQVKVHGPAFEAVWKRHYAEGRPFSYLEQEYGGRLLSGERPRWTCRAGSRFLYVDEDGKVELCSAQRGRLGKPITEYTERDLDAQRQGKKGCEEGCSILCAYRDSLYDNDPIHLAKVALKELYRSLVSPPYPKPKPGPTPDQPSRRRLPVVLPPSD